MWMYCRSGWRDSKIRVMVVAIHASPSRTEVGFWFLFKRKMTDRNVTFPYLWQVLEQVTYADKYRHASASHTHKLGSPSCFSRIVSRMS